MRNPSSSPSLLAGVLVSFAFGCAGLDALRPNTQDAQVPSVVAVESAFEARLARARASIPRYEGRELDHLTREQATGVRAAIHALESLVDEAAPEFLALRRVRHDLVHAWILLGNDACQRGDARELRQSFERAFDAAGEALRDAPDDAWLHYKRGIALLALGSPREAAPCFTAAIEAAQREQSRALDLDGAPRDQAFAADIGARARFERAVALAQSGEHELARRELQGLLDASGDDHLREGSWRTLAQLELAGGDRSAASLHLRAAIGAAVDWRYTIEPLLLELFCCDDAARSERCVADMLDLVEHAPRDELDLAWSWTLLAFVVAAHEERTGASRLPATERDRLRAAGWDPARSESFAACIAAEERERNGGRWAIGGLRAAGWLQVGRALELEAGAASLDRRGALLERARRAYAQAANSAPLPFTWEALHARHRARELLEGR